MEKKITKNTWHILSMKASSLLVCKRALGILTQARLPSRKIFTRGFKGMDMVRNNTLLGCGI